MIKSVLVYFLPLHCLICGAFIIIYIMFFLHIYVFILMRQTADFYSICSSLIDQMRLYFI